MNKSTLLTTLLTANINFEKYSRNYRRLILLNVLLYITMFLAVFFIFINIFMHSQYIVASMNVILLIFVFYASYDIHKHKRMNKAINIFVGILFIFLLAFTLVNENNNFGLIWSIFLPVVALLVMGGKQGIFIVLAFYLFLFSSAYVGIGIWENGHWQLIAFMRFFAASLSLSFILYFMEYSQELAEDKLSIIREKECDYIDKLHSLSIHDPLTGLFNRRHLQDVFTKEFQTASRHKYYFGFFILDIDYFKQYNDTYGHLKGDTALCTLAEALKTYMRRSEDFVFRLGGEEFCGICVNEDKSKIVAQLKVLHHAIESLSIEHKSSSVLKVLTVSMGVKIINSYEDNSFENMYKEADEALFAAKESGRNTIKFVNN